MHVIFKWSYVLLMKSLNGPSFSLPNLHCQMAGFLKGCLLKLNRAILVWAHKNFVKEIMSHVKEIMGHVKEIILSKKKNHSRIFKEKEVISIYLWQFSETPPSFACSPGFKSKQKYEKRRNSDLGSTKVWI